MKFQKASIKLVLSVQNSQIHLKKYRDSQAKQKNFTCLHHTNLSSIDYWITMTISTFATSLSSPLNHERNNHRQILQSWHQIGGLRFRVIFVKILGLNKKGSNPSVKMVMYCNVVLNSTVTMHTSHKPIAHWVPHHSKHQYPRNIYAATNEISKN